MIRWIPYTFIRIVIFLIAGILLGIYFPDIIQERLACILIIALTSVFIILFVLNTKIRVPFLLFSALAFTSMFLCGYVRVLEHNEIRNARHFAFVQEPITWYTVTIDNYSEEKQKSWKVTGIVNQIRTNVWRPVRGRVVLYFDKKAFHSPFRYGDVLLVRGRPFEVNPPSNPGEFNYQRFLSFRNIFHQHFISGDHVHLIGNRPPDFFKQQSIDARIWANKILQTYVAGEREQAIASALILGITDGLDNELLSAYSATGAMHVLAVSGLHISIIYILILWSLKPLTKTKHGNWLVVLTALFILWAYAFITGLSPSVLRAVTMFSFVIFARVISRSTNIFNTIAVSAFCLLLFDPNLIMSVGFQLSYLAVIGIIYFQPRIYRAFEFRSYASDKIWSISSVAIAAQLATFPLGLLYFHQFPNHFLLANLVVIPASFIVLVGGMVLLASSIVSFASAFIGMLVTYAIKFMNICVMVIEQLPFAVIENIQIGILECWLLMLLIIAIDLLIVFKKFNYVIVVALLATCISGVQWAESYNLSQGKMIVYKVPGHTAIDIITENSALSLMDSGLYTNQQKISYHITPARLLNHVSHVESFHDGLNSYPISGGKLLISKGKILLQVTDRRFRYPRSVKPAVVIVSNEAIESLHLIAGIYPTANVIIDSSNSFSYSRRLKAQAASLSLKCHSVMLEGAMEDRILEKT